MLRAASQIVFFPEIKKTKMESFFPRENEVEEH
jgi:hypothetical protein